MARYRYSWNVLQKKRLNEVLEVLEEYRSYWPLTLRQVYYQLVGKGYVENKSSVYKSLSQLIKWARIDGHISWGAIEDRVRAMHFTRGFTDINRFVDQEVGNFLTGFHRHLVQDQDVMVECWIEKDALSSIFSRVTRQYYIATVVCRGFSSVTFLNDFKRRCERSGKRPVLLYFGDFDPSGMEMLPSMIETLEDEMLLDGVEFKRIALQKSDITTYKLPHDPSAVKPSDSRYKKFIQKHGKYAVELDALPPDILTDKIIKAVEAELDMEKFRAQQELEDEESNRIDALRSSVEQYLEGLEY